MTALDPIPEPWKIPPPKAGDQVIFPVYAAVGLAITMWEMTELALAALYTSLTSEQDGEAFILKFEFDGSAGFQNRSKKVAQAFNAYAIANPNQKIEGRFEELMHKAGHLSMRRNDIAHGMVMNSQGWAEGDPKGFLLWPALQNYRRYRDKYPSKRPVCQLNSQQIVAFAEDFVDLRHDIDRFRDSLFGTGHPWQLAAMPEHIFDPTRGG